MLEGKYGSGDMAPSILNVATKHIWVVGCQSSRQGKSMGPTESEPLWVKNWV